MLTFILAIWTVLCQLAPWLLFGMLLSGLLHVLLPAGFVRKRFRGAAGVVSAVTLGIPLPLCSCGVVPAGIGLKNQGASDGAAVGFLISTPQTGVDSILVSASFFGWPFAIFKMAAALVTGVVGGLLVDGRERFDEPTSSDTEPQSSTTESEKPKKSKRFQDIFTHGIDILRSIWVWLLIGIVASAAIETAVPESWIAMVSNMGLVASMLLVLVVSTPLYVCATSSVPIAAALVSAGLPTAAALVFLMAGPATNVTTMGAIYGRFGSRTLVIYLSSIIGGSMLFAWLFDGLLSAASIGTHAHIHDHNHWVSIFSAVILLVLLGGFVWEIIRGKRGRLERFSDVGQIGEFQVTGLHCQNCVNKLERALSELAGLSRVHVDLKTETVQVTGEFSTDEIKQTVSEAGFKAVL